MKAVWRMSVHLALLALICAAAWGVSCPAPLSHPLTLGQAIAVAGGFSWGNFGAGIVCGAGIVAIAGGALSGVGAPGAILIVSGVAGACAGMFA